TQGRLRIGGAEATEARPDRKPVATAATGPPPWSVMNAPDVPRHQIRALHTDTTVTVYQAYTPSIGLPAAREGRFPSSWKRERMTWIKPSYLIIT
ncbi:DUF4291 family protein, partial [Bacillus mobilis]